MSGTVGSLGRLRLRLPAALIIFLLPSLLQAETIIVQNTTSIPIVVQASSIVNGQVSRAAPAMLNPTEVTPGIHLPGNKVITIYDAKMPNKVLYQGVIAAGAKDMTLEIIVDPKTGKFVRLDPKAPTAPEK